MTQGLIKPQIILHRSEHPVYNTIKGYLRELKLPYCEINYLAGISDKSLFDDACIAIAIGDQEKDGIDFLRSVMHFDHLIQRVLLSALKDVTSFEKAINKAHINYFLSLPADQDKFETVVRKARKRYNDLTRPFKRLQMLSRITKELFSDKERYKQEALTDSLTGLLNRKAFNSLLNSMFQNSLEGNSSLSFTLAMLDLDHFKKINDQFGHVAGDRVLKSFGTLLSENVRDGLDQAFRYGGEEFAVLSFHSSLEDAFRLLQRVKELVQQHHIEYEGAAIEFRFSAGIADSARATSAEHLIELADRQLYRAKSEGRNRICFGKE